MKPDLGNEYDTWRVVSRWLDGVEQKEQLLSVFHGRRSRDRAHVDAGIRHNTSNWVVVQYLDDENNWVDHHTVRLTS